MKKKSLLLYLVVFVLLISFILKIGVISEAVAGLLGTSPEQITDVASLVFFSGLGVLCLFFASGILSAGLLFLGVPLAIVGVGLIAMAVIDWKRRPKPL